MQTYTIRLYKNGRLNLTINGLTLDQAKSFKGAWIIPEKKSDT